MERFKITRGCMHETYMYAAGDIIHDHVVGEHLCALGFAEHAADDDTTDTTESEPTTSSRRSVAESKE